jgi:hypothetical protein
MASICTSNVTSGFIDLATFDELEKYMYGGKDATAYFVRETKKATWFTQVPVVLSPAAGKAGFDTEWSVSISRAGDYLLAAWLRLTTPKITTSATFRTSAAGTYRIRWTRNLMHNIIKECCITFNDLVAARFDNYHLDFWAAFTVPSGKQGGYGNMIGNFGDLCAPHAETLESFTLNLPLPLFFTRDSGVALPTAALPYNDMRINFSFRNWTELLIVDHTAATGSEVTSVGVVQSDIDGTPTIPSAQVWANYAIVSNDERKGMACAPRDFLIEQVQTAPRQSYDPNTTPRYDLRFSHAIKVFFFAVRNISVSSSWSNYTACTPRTNATSVLYDTLGLVDPISSTSLIYENTNRLSSMGSDYFSLVNPWYHAPNIPADTGYHMYSYSLDFMSLDPLGSTNYGKLTNVSIVPESSETARLASKGTYTVVGVPTGGEWEQKYEFITTCINNNVVRASGGALGFPVL